MDQAKLALAVKLESEAALLRKQAFEGRPLPERWEAGHRVRYIKNSKFAFAAGEEAVIVEIRKSDIGKPAAEYQVFWTSRDYVSKTGRFWTTPDEVEMITDDQ